ncbi:FAD-dependent oxidoreductase [Sphingomonas sp. DT-207]|uniref:FAD-dependent oxidoreductase n=1 Tax=Sphingomonas sp. DT-207 TaxID=3396167 RepID=UPI003F1E3A5D
MSDRTIRSIAVLGGGIVGLSAAAALARTFPAARVELVETPDDAAALADRLPGSTTAVHRCHASIGLDEQQPVRAGAATHRVALRFERWSANGETWFHLHGDHGHAAGTIPFHQLWARARRAGQATAYHRYAGAGVLAEADRFVHPQADPRSPLSNFDYALRLDPGRYRALLGEVADQMGVARSRGEFGGIEQREDGGVAALLLRDGRRIEADLFVDASGPSARLLTAIADRFEDWSGWLPCDSVLLGAAASGAPAPCDTIEAMPGGWRWHAPAGEGTMQGAVYAARHLADPRTAFGIDADPMTIRPGFRPEPWVRNVVAIGDAAAAVDPLHWMPLHLAHRGIARMIELLPGRDCHPVEIAEHNRRARLEVERVRDFLALHYHRSGVTQGPLWQEAARAPVPDSLAHTLAQFERRGRLPEHDEDWLDREYWLSALFGLGVIPSATTPAAEAVNAAAAANGMAQIAAGLAQLPARVPPYPDYLAKMRGG